MRWSTALFAAAIAIVAFRFWLTEPRTRNDGAGMIVGAIMFLALLVAAFGALLRVAGAHDHNRPELNGWMKSLHSKSKTWCCDGNDHDTIDDWETGPKGYRVKFRGQWFDVPDSAIVEGPNKAGVPLLWMDKGFSVGVRCFQPGPLT